MERELPLKLNVNEVRGGIGDNSECGIGQNDGGASGRRGGREQECIINDPNLNNLLRNACII